MSVPASAEADARASEGTTLIVDDDRTFCGTLAAALRRRGLSAVVAYGFEEALAEAAVWQPVRAVVDLRMPQSGGLELTRELSRRHPGIRIVVLTGYGSIATAVEAIKLGAVHYLTKPASVTEILSAFRREEPWLAEVKPTASPMSLGDVEWEHLQQVLAAAGGNISEAARRLGMHRRTLQRKLARRR